jgi:bifunctional non-homologous end joining protein LigD
MVTAPDFIPIQKPKLVAAPPTGPGWIHEAKLDGDRMQLRVVGGAAAWRSRAGTDRSAWFPDLDAAARLPDCILDGELCALDHGRASFSLLQKWLGARQRGQIEGELAFFVFDLLFHDGELLLERPLSERRERLARLVAAHRDLPFLRSTPPAPADDPLDWARRQGLEGVVSKRLEAPYRPGARTPEWRKAKWRPSQEVVIGGWAMRTPDTFRSLLVGVYEDGRLRYVGRVGTGYDRESVAALLPRLRAVESDRCPFQLGVPPRTGDVHWTRPELVANIAFAEWTRAGQVRQASFQGLRDDKAPREVVAERPAAGG